MVLRSESLENDLACSSFPFGAAGFPDWGELIR